MSDAHPADEAFRTHFRASKLVGLGPCDHFRAGYGSRNKEVAELKAQLRLLEDEKEMLFEEIECLKTKDSRSALREMLLAWEEQFGEGACDCMPEPENIGHVCQCCMARNALSLSTSSPKK